MRLSQALAGLGGEGAGVRNKAPPRIIPTGGIICFMLF